ncbi:MAG: diaminopimelate epimerase [Thermodesulfovibrionales bacterium]
MTVKFTKMHALGNDFVVIDARGGAPGDLADLAKRLCRRRFGVGCDQLLVLSDSSRADFRMTIHNADGGEVEMCGNGIRCLAKYIWDRGLSGKKVLDIETPAGIIRPERAEGGMVRVDMGEPVLEGRKIPVDLDGPVKDHPVEVDGETFLVTCVSMGNPHAVIFVENLGGLPVDFYGPKLERHPLFPRRTNVEFVEVLNRGEIRMRVWERGAGETLACGTGASAAAVASALKGLTENRVAVHLEGGDLLIEWAPDGRVFMTGPAEEVFEGEIKI